jgi:formate hydrogenlyase subunit 3/multisubunit Na+/H+ antiporter MnhD subunit
MPEAQGIAGLFAPLLLAGGLVIALASLYRADPRPWHYPLVAVLLLAIQTLLSATTALSFYVAWEFITLASFFLIAQRGPARAEVLRFLIFSLLAAFLIFSGFAVIAAETGMRDLAALSAAPASALPGFMLLGLGFLIKTSAVGLHVWMPGAYAEAPDDVSAMLSAVVSKVAIFGLFMATYVALRTDLGSDFNHGLAWIGMATTIVGAVLALSQTDVKRLLAFSSMSQLGYIITAVALMSHIGWVTALYLVANHMLVKGILFLAIAGIIMRTSTRSLHDLGGLAPAMPLTCVVIGVALLSMSGLPPLMGFGGKWLLLSAMVDKGWTGLAVAGAFATFLGLWYMLRLFTALFLRPPPTEMQSPEEAPAILFVAHTALIGGILILSLFPKLLMEPVSAAIDPVFAANLVWQGQSLETIYGLWNPAPVMGLSVAAAAILFLGWRGLSRLLGHRLSLGDWIMTARPLPAKATPPLAETFWRATDRATHRLAAVAQHVYTGDGQTYVLWVLAYFLALTFAWTLSGA